MEQGRPKKPPWTKKKDHILEAADRFGENIVHCVAKVVGLISNLAIITKRIYYIWIYCIVMSSVLYDIYDPYLLSFHKSTAIKFRLYPKMQNVFIRIIKRYKNGEALGDKVGFYPPKKKCANTK